MALNISTVPLLNKKYFGGFNISDTIGYKVFINGKKFPRGRSAWYSLQSYKTKTKIIRRAVKEFNNLWSV